MSNKHDYKYHVIIAGYSRIFMLGGPDCRKHYGDRRNIRGMDISNGQHARSDLNLPQGLVKLHHARCGRLNSNP